MRRERQGRGRGRAVRPTAHQPLDAEVHVRASLLRVVPAQAAVFLLHRALCVCAPGVNPLLGLGNNSALSLSLALSARDIVNLTDNNSYRIRIKPLTLP